jgi:hypothetical protein
VLEHGAQLRREPFDQTIYRNWADPLGQGFQDGVGEPLRDVVDPVRGCHDPAEVDTERNHGGHRRLPHRRVVIRPLRGPPLKDLRTQHVQERWHADLGVAIPARALRLPALTHARPILVQIDVDSRDVRRWRRRRIRGQTHDHTTAACTTSASAAATPVLLLVHDLHVRVLTTSGGLLRDFQLDPSRDYQPQQKNPQQAEGVHYVPRHLCTMSRDIASVSEGGLEPADGRICASEIPELKALSGPRRAVTAVSVGRG